MASGAIKGITIKLGADASELTTSLNKIEKEISTTTKSLRNINTALKFNPGNVELLQQKFNILKQRISENDNYVEQLKKALAQMKAKGVDETSEEFTTLQAAISRAENEGRKLNSQLDETQAELNQTDSGLKKVNSSLKNVDTTKATNSLNTMKVAMGNLIAQGIMRLSSAITNNLGAAISRSDTLANFPKVMEGMGISAKASATAVQDLAAGIEGLPTTLDNATNGVKQFAAVNGDVKKSTEYFIAFNNAVVAGGASADIQATALEQLSQAYAKGKPDMQEWRAMMTAMPAQLNQVASAMGMTASELGEGLRNGTISMDDFMQKIVELNTQGGQGFKSFEEQAKGASGGIATSMSTMGTAVVSGMQKVIDAIGRDNIASAFDTIKTAIKGVFTALASFVNFVQANMGIIAPIVAGITAAFLTYYTVTTAITAATKAFAIAQGILNAVMAANPVLLIVMGIMALIAALVVAYKKSETFRSIIQALGGVFKTIGTTIASVVRTIISKFTSLVSTAKSVASKIKSAFLSIVNGMKNIGLNIVKGIGNGITSGVGWIKEKIKSFVGDVKSFLKRLFGIKSPSKWAEEIIGLNIVKGMAVGIADNKGIVNSAMTNMVNSATPTLSSVSNEMANAVGTGLAIAGTGGSSKPVQITVNLGGAKVAEQVFKLNNQGAVAMG